MYTVTASDGDRAHQRCDCQRSSGTPPSLQGAPTATRLANQRRPRELHHAVVTVIAVMSLCALLCAGIAPLEAAPLTASSLAEEEALLGRLLVLLGDEHAVAESGDSVDVSDSGAEVAALPSWRGRRRQMQRLRKRHSQSLYVERHLAASQDDLEWDNPCGGYFEPQGERDSAEAASERVPMRHYLGLLRDTTNNEYYTLKKNLNAINLRDFADWQHHKHNYKFLPTLKRNSSVALKRWYRHSQVFVGVFAHLSRAQVKWERSKQLPVSGTSLELNELLISARRILCEIESIINGSYPNSSREKLTPISRDEMNQRIAALLTKDTQEAYTPDLKFSKHRYLNFLAKMNTILDGNLRRRKLQQNFSSSRNRSQESSDQNSNGDDAANMSLSSMELLRSDSSGQSNHRMVSAEVRPAGQRPSQKRQRSPLAKKNV